MSARENIAELLWQAVPSVDDAEAAAKAEQMLDAYDHELAEKIRDEAREFLAERYGFGGDPKSPWVGGLMSAADLIDPEVTE